MSIGWAALALLAAQPAAADEVWRVDRIRVEGLRDPQMLAALKDDHSEDAVAAHLARLHLRFTRGPVSLRLADLPGGLAAQLRALPPGEPFVLPTAEGITVNARLPDDAATDPAPAWQPDIPGEPDAARLAAARALLDAAIPPAERDRFFGQMVDTTSRTLVGNVLRLPQIANLVRAHPTLRPVIDRFAARQRALTLADLHTYLPQLLEAQAIGYARLFTRPELKRLTDFFRQPLGRRFLAQSLLLPLQPEMVAWTAGANARAQERLPAEAKQLADDIRSTLAGERNSNVL